LAREEGLPFLGEVPLASEISQCCDQGISLFEKNPETSAAQALKEIAQEVVEQLEAFSALEGECLGGSKIIHQNSHSFCVEWSDGEKSEYSFKEILPHCRCVRCKKTPPAFFEGEVEANGIQKVGRFGVRIQFKQGCSKGIYSFEFLRHFRQVQG
jgi:DUF971 family protein